jgi:hypothetical protein
MRYFRSIAALLLALLTCTPALAAYRGAASTVNATSGNSCVVTVSGIGIQLGDVLLFIAGTANNSKTFTYPTGFSAVPGLSNINITSNGGGTIGVAYKIATSTEVSASTLTATTSDSPGWLACHVRDYSGRNTSSPFSAVATTATTAATGNPLNFTLTGLTAVAGDDVVSIVGINNATEATTYTTPPTGFANTALLDNGGNFNPNFAAADKVNVSAGATGSLTGSIATFGGSYGYAGYVISLAVAGGGGSCTHNGHAKDGSVSVPNGSSGFYWGKSGDWVTPDCSSVYYWSPAAGNFVVN